MAHRVMASPLGTLTLVAGDRGLRAVLWPDAGAARPPADIGDPAPDDPLLGDAARQLNAYFAGRATGFDVPLDLRGTPFQQAVWAALLTIPFGETRSYAAIARQIGRPAAVRAVGAANGRNPVAILVPCHRVVGTGGAMTGFAGGIGTKERLLRLERDGPDLIDRV